LQQVRLNFTLKPEGSTSPSAQDPTTPQRVRVGARILAANLVRQVKPEYPAEAKANRIQGEVVLETYINKEGMIDQLVVISGHPLLTPAAIDAVKQWVYKPTLLNGQPIDAVSTVTVNFQLQD
jgi:TonB family protein